MIQNNYSPAFKGLFKIEDTRVIQAEKNFSKILFDKVGQICYDEYASRLNTSDGLFILSDTSRDANIFSKLLKEGIKFLYKSLDVEEINLHNIDALNNYFKKMNSSRKKITIKLRSPQKYWLN